MPKRPGSALSNPGVIWKKGSFHLFPLIFGPFLSFGATVGYRLGPHSDGKYARSGRKWCQNIPEIVGDGPGRFSGKGDFWVFLRPVRGFLAYPTGI